MTKYNPISVDTETRNRLVEIARARGLDERRLDVVVRRLVKEEYARLLAAQLLRDDTDKAVPQQSV